MNSETQRLFEDRLSGQTTVVTRDGKTIITGACEVRSSSTVVNTGPTQPVDSSTAPIQDSLVKLQCLQASKAAYNFGVPYSSSFPNLFTGALPPDTQCSYAVTDKNNEFYTACINKAIVDLRAAEVQTERNRQINTCIEENLKTLSSNSADLFDKLIDVALSQGVNFLLGKINQNLPEYAQVGLSLSPDNKIQNFTVGPVRFDEQRQEVLIDGRVFSALVDDGLQGFNAGMPDYFQLSADDLSLSLGDISVSYDSLFGVDPKDPSKVIPKTSQNLGSGVAVQVNAAGTVEVVKGREVFSIGKVVSSLGVSIFNQGLNQANSLLPDYLQVRGSFPLGLKDGNLAYSNRDLSIGPVKYSAETDSVRVDTVGLTNDLAGYAEDLLLSNVPAPLAPLAQVAWRAINPNRLLNDLLSGLVPSLTQDDRQKTYSRVKDSCTKKYGSVTPSPSYLPSGGSPPSIERQYVDPPLDSPVGFPVNPPTA